VRVLAVDPGLEKCGMAVCGPEGVLAHRVVAIHDLYHVSREWMESYRIDTVIVGDQTGRKHVFAILGQLGLRVEGVGERDSTLLARRRYFRDHPPRGWRRLVPLSLQVPPEPYDDYAAVVLAEAYLRDVPGRP
jgi:RNase H-fold protein (predicted Holliday junction resolvase)